MTQCPVKFEMKLLIHSVETPSTVDPQWKILYWGSKWNFYTVYWSAVDCGWGTTSVYFGITYVSCIPNRLPLLWSPIANIQIFLSKVSYEGHTQNLQNNSCWFKIWMGFVGQILIKSGTSFIRGFPWLPVWCTLGSNVCKHAGGHSVTTEACTSSHLTCLGLCGMEVWNSLELPELCIPELQRLYRWNLGMDQ